jgi:eukaryotic-like serine/threonine-protein kinase
MLVAGQSLARRFDLRRRIGTGGMGEVFEAYDREHNEVVALKTLAHADGATVARFKREFRALQSIAHPHLVSLRELVRNGDQWFFTMELIDGGHFIEHVCVGRARTGGGPRCDEARLRGALAQLVDALRTLHDAGLIHRDVKSSNVMVSRDDRVVLLDFGLVTDADPARQSTQGRPIGTVDYMAPEQAVGRPVSPATDWYAVGVLLYEALTGRLPHSGHVLQILVDKQQVVPTPPEQFAPHAPADLLALCRDLLHIEPGDRPDGDEVARRLGIDDDARRITRSSVIPTGSFVGRDRELADLAHALTCTRETPRVHLVVGESGIGKSELVARFTRELAERDPGALVLRGRCYERENVPFKALDGVADDLAHVLARRDHREVDDVLPARRHLLPRLFPVFQRVDAIASAAAATDEPADPLEQRDRMFRALRDLLGALAAAATVVITVDDLQWADADSYVLLRALLRGAGAPRVLVIATVRIEDAAADAVAEHLAGLAVGRTTLGPLSEDESLILAEHLAPGVGERTDLARLMREAGGHPLFLQEIVRHLDNHGAAATPTLDDALRARIDLLGPDARRLLEVVCLAGAPIATEVAQEACRIDATAVGRAAASLRVASLVRELTRGRGLALEPYHDRVREAVQNHLDDEPRRVHHARLAAALEASGERDPQLLLRHFVLGGLPERAAHHAEDAAHRSLAAHAFDQAAGHWRTALELIRRGPDDERRLRVCLAEALVAAGRAAEAAEHFLAAADGADPATSLECRRNAVEQLLISGRIERGIASLGQLLGEIGVGVPRTPRRALGSLLVHRARLRLRGLGFTERHRREIADADMIRLGVLRGAAHGLAMVDSIRGADFQTRTMLLALRTGYRPQIARALVLEAMFQATQCNLRRARSLVARAGEVAGAEPEPYVGAMSSAAHGLIAYFTGTMAPAFEHLSRAEDQIRQIPGSTWELHSTRIFGLFALRNLGDFLEMRRRYDAYLVDAGLRGDQYLDSTMRRTCTGMWLAEDDPGEALRDIERARWVPDTTAFHLQHYLELIARGDIALYAGEPVDGRLDGMFVRMSRSMLTRIVSVRTQGDYLRGRLAIRAGDLGRAAAAARRLGREANLLSRIWADLLRTAIARGKGDGDGAARTLDRVVDACGPAGMSATRGVARWRLAELRRDDTLGAAAEAELTALGVRRPDLTARLVLPWPASSG